MKIQGHDVEIKEEFGNFGVTIRTGGDGDFKLKLIVDGKKFLFK